ncbi:hypothetical protein KJ780_03965 [Candidatus Micrarchaeota archaeon]|nr:hypothetical protein [Candidatus Micrarchaeota archaeon]
MEPKELEEKLRNFLSQELSGQYYQCVLAFTDGKQDPVNPIGIKVGVVAVSNANPNTAPFSVLHGMLKALRMHIRNIHTGLYGGDMKQEGEEGLPERYY